MRTLLALLVACGHPAAPAQPAPVDRAPAIAPGSTEPSERECDALFAHVAALAAADQRPTATDADIASAQATLRGRELTGCRTMARATYACALAAASTDQLVACDP